MNSLGNMLGAMLAGQAAALETEQPFDRSVGIGGSDAMRIMAGDWVRLYDEKVGNRQSEDLSGVFKVQLGVYTEPFHADWFAKMLGTEVTILTDTLLHPDHEWMYAHLDRWLPKHKTFVELKHTRSGASVWEKSRFYMPQLQHYMAVTNTKSCYFSIIPGNDEPRYCEVERDDDYIENLIQMEQSFWWHVKEREAPEQTPFGELARVNKMAEAIKVDGYRVADMTKDNLWTDAAARFIANQAAAKAFDQAKDDLRSAVGDDVGEAYGHGVVAKRDSRGRVSIRAAKE